MNSEPFRDAEAGNHNQPVYPLTQPYKETREGGKELHSSGGSGYPNLLTSVNRHLTKEQQRVLCIVLLLLFTGLAVKTWRIAHPSTKSMASQPAHTANPQPK